jgi:hypothetical protein
MPRLTATVRARPELDEHDVARMYGLYARYYAGTSRELFRSDLDDKHAVIEVSEGETLCGFSTLAWFDFEAAGEPRRAIYSGDTIIDHRYWGEQTLLEAFCRFAGRLAAENPARPLYWFLISKGHRTFRYLGAFARSYFPNPHVPTPHVEQACIDRLARLRFGAAYLPDCGVIRYAEPHGCLKPEWAGVREGLRGRAEVEFFLERNPGYRDGDELACLTRLAPDNLRSFARRAFLEGLNGFDRDLLSPDRGRGGALQAAAESRPLAAAATALLDTRA